MISTIKTLLKKLGIDKAIAYSSGARVVQAFTGVGSIFFISTFLSGVEQGFYYTFGSIVAIQVFFELGLTGIITQFVAHEAAHLQLEASYKYSGEEKYRSRLASLLHFCVKWYVILSLIVLLVLLIVGFIFFNSYSNEENSASWELPWILLCVATAIKLLQSPFNSFIMGIGKVKEMSKISFYQQIILPLSSWLGLICGFKLYVIGISAILSVLIWNIYVFNTDIWKILKNLWVENISERVLYFKEIFPYQWRIALSWASGYFIFQMFNPVLFATEGAKVAGQMGMTLQALNAIQAFAMSWMNTKVPLYSGMISLKEYEKLDKLFNKTLWQMSSICLCLLATMYGFIEILRITEFKINTTIIADRFLDNWPMFFMMIPIMANQFVFSWATYLRCHKKEPFLTQSIVMGILCCVSTIGMGRLYGIYGITISYACLCIGIGTPWAYWIYRTKKREWHGK